MVTRVHGSDLHESDAVENASDDNDVTNDE